MDELNNALLDLSEDAIVTEENGNSLVVANTLPEVKKKKRGKKEKNIESRDNPFTDIALLLNKTEDEVIDDCVLYQLRKIMSGVGKVIVRHNVNGAELEKILVNAIALKMSEISIAPAYVPACKKKVKKLSLQSQKISAFIDFPFGESSFKSKMTDIKSSIKAGVDGVMVVMPTMLLSEENTKVLKAQVKKIGKLRNVETGIAVAASDLDKEQIKTLLKFVDKTGLKYVTFAFGDATEEEIKSRFEVIRKHKGKKQIKALGNVRTSEGVVEIVKLGADVVLTPYADEIGEDLVKRFNVKGVKLR